MKYINVVTIVLLLLLASASFMIMDKTAESNKITVDVAKLQSKEKSSVLQEVALLTAEMKNLQKDMSKILETLNEIKKKSSKKQLQ